MEEEPLMDETGDEEVGETVPYAHRDIKPGSAPVDVTDEVIL